MLLYILLLIAIAFSDGEVSYPWAYAAVLGVLNAIVLVFTGQPWAVAIAVGLGFFIYLGLVFRWLSKQSQFSFMWWLALLFAALPAALRYLVKAN